MGKIPFIAKVSYDFVFKQTIGIMKDYVVIVFFPKVCSVEHCSLRIFNGQLPPCGKGLVV